MTVVSTTTTSEVTKDGYKYTVNIITGSFDIVVEYDETNEPVIMFGDLTAAAE